MASKEELLEKKKDELLELAKDADLEGRSGMSKEELAEALADGDSSEEAKDEEAEVEAEPKADVEQDHDSEEPVALGHESEASDASDEEVVDELSPQGKEALNEMGDVAAAEADLALDASGPLHLQSPSERIMTGAVSEEHGKELEEALENAPEEWHGDVTEAGFDEDGNAAHVPGPASLQEQAVSDPDKTKGELRAAGELKQEDVIDYEAYEQEEDEEFDASAKLANGAGFGNSDVAGGGEYTRPFGQKAVFYTDGLGGAAEQNLERAYEIPELLQSNNPVVREAGDESLSKGAEKTDEEQQDAEDVKSGDRAEREADAQE